MHSSINVVCMHVKSESDVSVCNYESSCEKFVIKRNPGEKDRVNAQLARALVGTMR